MSDKAIFDFEGIQIEYEKEVEGDKEYQRRMSAYAFKQIREKSGMSRPEFAEWLGIPYRTMQEWELGRRSMPDYVLRLIAYKVKMEDLLKKLENKYKDRVKIEVKSLDEN